MARQKQATPLQRAPSSQLMQNEAEAPEKNMNGASKSSHSDGNATRKEAIVPETAVDSPGLMQLLICVLGIYAAL